MRNAGQLFDEEGWPHCRRGREKTGRRRAISSGQGCAQVFGQSSSRNCSGDRPVIRAMCPMV